MKKYSIEIKWAIIFAIMGLVWMLLERITGLHSDHIDKHPIYTNLIAIPAITVYVLALLDKRKNFYNGTMTYKQGFFETVVFRESPKHGAKSEISMLRDFWGATSVLLVTKTWFLRNFGFAMRRGRCFFMQMLWFFSFWGATSMLLTDQMRQSKTIMR